MSKTNSRTLRFAGLMVAGLLGASCLNPYERLQGEYNAGPVDPLNFIITDAIPD